jgi:rSAM/selenodomain-associated transferase 1
MMRRLLIIFYRNPEFGKVKSRLAVTVGEDRALAIYMYMVAHTRRVSSLVSVDRVVYYSSFIDREDDWSNDGFAKRLQHGEDLGERMKHTFAESFKSGYNSICIIGTDCLEITEEILANAFEALDHHDAVIGPAADGGYYLLGMNQFIPELFDNKEWSTSSVGNDTIDDFRRLKYSYHLLPMLHDIDTEEDLPQYLR